MSKLLVAVVFVSLNAYVYYFMASEELYPARRSMADFPLALGDWHCANREKMTEDVLANLGVTDYLICTYQRRHPVGLVNVYVGYHASQVRKEGGGSGGGLIHPPKHCLPGSGWDIIDSTREVLDFQGLPGAPVEVNRLITAKGEARQLVYYWYQERGRVIADDWMKIFYQFWDRARLKRTDGSLVRFTVPVLRNDLEKARQAFLDLAPQVTSRLAPYVPQ